MSHSDVNVILEDIPKGKVYLQKCFPSKLEPQNHFQSIALMFIKFVLNTSNCGRVHLVATEGGQAIARPATSAQRAIGHIGRVWKSQSQKKSINAGPIWS